ncbi:hypothetical protein [Streptomyces sp. NPDC056660]|uniref:hypothetical protein n=1 Tax=Streptomyces sp. NPDC056660 TaxID=3345897 RepID=UPI0036AB78FB
MCDWLCRVSADEADDERPDRDDAAFTLFADLIQESLLPPEVSAVVDKAGERP